MFARLCRVLSVLSLLSISTLSQAQLADPLAIENGLLSGDSSAAGMQVYRGIPYAAPPTGANRWRAPAAVPDWAGIRDASSFAARCVQGGFTPGANQPLTSEDCLYLNVWTPARSATDLLPVMVWIHGGGFFTGAGSAEIYDGASLASKGAVVVTLNYRLGTFGFFAHPALSEESPHNSSGNYAMLDMLAALQWVQSNIEAFGGHPEKITIFGESAGAEAVANLIASPLSEGLFQRAILQSGGWMGLGPGKQTRLAAYEQQGLEQAQDFGADSLEALRQTPAQAIAENFPSGGDILVDGYFLPDDASLILARGEQQKVAVMTGSNRDESVFFGPGPDRAQTFLDSIDSQYGALSEQFLNLYPAHDDEQANASYHHSFNDTLAWQMRHLANEQVDAGHNGYTYFFTRVPPGQEARGATHVAELAYVFNQHAQHPEWRDTDRELADIMSSYWVNFAETGDPNRVGLPSWPVYTSHTAGKVQVLGDTVHNETEMLPEATELEFFEQAHKQLLEELKASE